MAYKKGDLVIFKEQVAFISDVIEKKEVGPLYFLTYLVVRHTSVETDGGSGWYFGEQLQHCTRLRTRLLYEKWRREELVKDAELKIKRLQKQIEHLRHVLNMGVE